MAEEKTQSNRKINKKLIIIAASIIIVATIGLIALIVPKTVKAQRLEKQLDLGAKYLSELDYEQAVVAYLAAIEIDPKCEDAYFALADTYVAMGEYDKAEEILDKAAEELGEEAVKSKRDELAGKQKEDEPEPTTPEPEPPTPEPETTTPEPEPPTPEPETTTPEPETTTEPLPAAIELTFAPEDFTYGDKEGYYVCTGLSQSGYDKFSEHNYEDEVVLKLPSVSSTGVVVEGLYSDKSSQYGFDKFLGAAGPDVHIVCPDTYKIYSVDDAGFKLGSIISVELNYGLEIIGKSSFANSALVSIEIPETVKSIENRTFSGCDRLVIETLNTKGMIIGQDAFRDVTIKELIISDSLEIKSTADDASGTRAAFYKTKIENIVFEDGIKKIPAYVFKYCEELTEIVIPDTVTEIGESGFANCERLSSIVLPTKLTHIGGAAFWCCSGIKEIIIPETVVSIGNVAFYECIGLNKLNLPSSVKEIGREAFYGCTKLQIAEVDITSKLIGTNAFDGATIDKVIIDEDVTYYTAYPSVFAGANIKEVAFSSDIKRIPDNILSSCGSITDIVIPNTVTAIGKYAFNGCENLKTITIPNSVTEIGSSAFYPIKNLVIRTTSGSYAEKYANENGIKVEIIGGTQNTPEPETTTQVTLPVLQFPSEPVVVESEPVSFTLPEEKSEAVFYVDVVTPSSAIEVTIFNEANKFDAHVSYDVRYLQGNGEEASIGSVGIAMYASNAINKNDTVSFLAENPGRYGIYISNAVRYNNLYYSGTNVNELQMKYRVVSPDANEPNNEVQYATKINCNEYAYFNLLGEKDNDWFEVYLEEGVTEIKVTIGSESGKFDSALGYTINQYDAATDKSTVVHSMWGSYASNAIKKTNTKKYKIEAAGAYYINVANASARNSYYYSGDNENYLYILVEPVK